MAEDFSADGMLDMYLYENGQLLEQLEATTLEKRTRTALMKQISMSFSESCTPLKVRQGL